MIDDRIGMILASLEQTGAADDTVVVFTSDHGDMMGEHGLLLKGFMHYRGTLQVPMLIRVPQTSPCRTDGLASSVDLGPTLMDICGVEEFDGIQGRALTPMLGDAGATVRDHVLIEDDIAPVISQLTPIPAKTRTLITPTHRYTRNSKGEEQLFDLQRDPQEMVDLKGKDRDLRSRMVERLADALIAADDAARGAPAVG
jgi:arylsulfatase A-like enzyme